MVSLFLTSLILILFQISFLLLVLSFNFGLNSIASNIVPLLIIFIHLLTVFILLGIALAYGFKSIQVSILVTTFVMLFLFLLSDVIVPTNVMPPVIGFLVDYSPVVMGENIIRKIFFFENFQLTYRQFLFFYLYIFLLIGFVQNAAIRRRNSEQ